MRGIFSFLFVILIAGLSYCFIGCQGTGVNIWQLTPKDGHFNAAVVIPMQATDEERYAADELAAYILKITGTGIAVVQEKPDSGQFGFYIGKTEKAMDIELPSRSPFNGGSGFRMKSVEHGLLFAGGDELSTLYAVYSFLEECQGCAWIMPNEIGEIVPSNTSIAIPENIDVTQVPDIPIRWMFRGDLALKNRMNVGISVGGREAGVINKWNYHTFRILVPDSVYLAIHPEYFSMMESKRVGGEERGQICTSNPEVVRLVTQHLLNELERDPSINFISLTANDWAGFCLCSRCAKQIEEKWKDDRHGSASGPIHIFDNEVARRVKKYAAEPFVKVGAYSRYLRYPLDPSYKPEDNLAIMFTPHIHYCHNHAITDNSCPHIEDFMHEYYQWAENTNHLQIFAYECLHGWANLFWPMVHILKKDMPEYHRTGVEQFYTQTGSNTQSYALNYYVAAKLAWDASLHVSDLVRVFCEKSYGAAGPEMEKFHAFLEDSWEDNPNHIGYGTEPTPVSILKFFPPDVMQEAELLLATAEVEPIDGQSKERVHLVRLELEFLKLILNYLNEISKPFEGIDPQQNPDAWGKAEKEAHSIGERLVPGIMQYYKESYSENMQRGWPLTGLESLLRTHTRAANIPGAQRPA